MRIRFGLTLWLLLGLSGISLGRIQCFPEVGPYSSVNATDILGLGTNCDTIPSLIVNSTPVEGSLLDLKAVSTVAGGSFVIQDQAGLVTIDARLLTYIQNGEAGGEFHIEDCLSLTTFKGAATGLKLDSMPVYIQNTALEAIPPLSATQLGDLVIRNNSGLSNVSLDVASIGGVLDIESPAGTKSLSVSFPNLKSIYNFGTSKKLDSGSPVISTLQLGSPVSKFDAPALTLISGNAYIEGTRLEVFEIPRCYVTGTVALHNNGFLKSVKVAATNKTTPVVDFSISMLNNTLLRNINFSSMFVLPEGIKTGNAPIQFNGDVVLAGPIESIDTSGFHFNGAFQVNSSSQLDCDALRHAVSSIDNVFGCVSRGDNNHSFVAQTSSPTPLSTSSKSHRKKVILAATLPPILCILAIAGAVLLYIYYRRTRMPNRTSCGGGAGKTQSNLPGADALYDLELQKRSDVDPGVLVPRRLNSPLVPSSSYSPSFHELPAEFEPEHYYRGFIHPNTPINTPALSADKSFGYPPDATPTLSQGASSAGEKCFTQPRTPNTEKVKQTLHGDNERDSGEDFNGQAVTTYYDDTTSIEDGGDDEIEVDSSYNTGIRSTMDSSMYEQSVKIWLASEDLPMTIDRRSSSRSRSRRYARNTMKSLKSRTGTVKTMKTTNTEASVRSWSNMAPSIIEEFYGAGVPYDQKVQIERAREVRMQGWGTPPRIESFRKKPLPLLPPPELPLPPPSAQQFPGQGAAFQFHVEDHDGRYRY